MKFEIKHRWSGALLFSIETDSWKLALKAAIKAKVDLSGSNLSGSDLSYSDLSYSNLRNSNLRGSDLSGSNLRNSDLRNSEAARIPRSKVSSLTAHHPPSASSSRSRPATRLRRTP